MSTVRFDAALEAALRWAESQGRALDLVRDLHGKFRVVPSAGFAPTSESIADLHACLGAYSPGIHSLILPSELLNNEDAAQRIPLAPGIALIDRMASEQNWSLPPVARNTKADRVVFFGVKGGVGRTTALTALALYLTKGHSDSSPKRRVLVVDLDLESPGSTATLLNLNDLPRFGIVDGLVEDAVGQADSDLFADMFAVSPFGEGNLFVAPALGTNSVPATQREDDCESTTEDQNHVRNASADGSFISKLGRAYASVRGEDFATRLERILENLEAVVAPDVVLIDSRAGLHDISAVAVPRLSATRVLLFAGASNQTWLGYRLLLSSFRRRPEVVTRFRNELQVVASLVPETERKHYLDRVRLQAYDAFSDFLYDSDDRDQKDSLQRDANEQFTFDIGSEDAPHAALPIYWRRELVEWSPATATEALTPEQFDAAFGEFLRGIEPHLRQPGSSQRVAEVEVHL